MGTGVSIDSARLVESGRFPNRGQRRQADRHQAPLTRHTILDAGMLVLASAFSSRPSVEEKPEDQPVRKRFPAVGPLAEFVYVPATFEPSGAVS